MKIENNKLKEYERKLEKMTDDELKYERAFYKANMKQVDSKYYFLNAAVISELIKRDIDLTQDKEFTELVNNLEENVTEYL